jgi:DNA processing protein
MMDVFWPDEEAMPLLPDTPEERQALVALSMVPGVGPGRIRSLLARFGAATAALTAPRKALAEVPGIGPQTATAIASFDDHPAVEAQFRRAVQAGATLVTTQEEPFPRLLREIYDPPAFLWVQGTLFPADEQAIAIVGTRRATDYGKRVAHEFAAALAGQGFTIISGLAYGIDAAAHRGALEAGGRTLAVLGSGVDRIYPSRHLSLAREIAAHGALLSEYPMGAEPEAPNFPRRNRIISGLSRGVLVVEAHETGGALITARMAQEQNREVFAIPGPIHSRASLGSHQLIQQGYAKLVSNVEDMLVELGTPQAQPLPLAPAALPELHPVEQILYTALTDTPVHLDTLCMKTDLDPSTALVYLLGLEFKGLVRQMAGKQFFRA